MRSRGEIGTWRTSSQPCSQLLCELDELDSPSVRVEAGVAVMVPAARQNSSSSSAMPSRGDVATSEPKIGISGAGVPTGSSGAG
jgi:hypothetical protein